MQLDWRRYIGKELITVEGDIRCACKAQGYSFSVLDPDFKTNIDVNARRLNVLIDGADLITKIFVG